MIKLREAVIRAGIVQAELSRDTGISRAAISNMLNKGKFPKRIKQKELIQKLKKALSGKIIWSDDLLETAGLSNQHVAQALSPKTTNTEAQEMADMLLRKQSLTPEARRAFGLIRNPFSEESMQSSDDVFLTADIRYVRETLWSAANFGGFAAIIGESGAGKSTLRRDLIARIEREGEAITIIEPYVLGMEENDNKGKTLKAASIAQAIIRSIDPLATPRRTPEALYRQVHELLKSSAKAGNRHLLIIEEAHCLPRPTLKHLKRFWELEDGFRKLLGIVLIGQTELRKKLSETDPEVREVTQRIELIQLQPLDDELESYLTFKFKRIGKPLSEIITQDGIDAMRQRLVIQHHSRGEYSLLYPLAVNNFLAAAMNISAELGFDVVDADQIKEV